MNSGLLILAAHTVHAHMGLQESMNGHGEWLSPPPPSPPPKKVVRSSLLDPHWVSSQGLILSCLMLHAHI